LNSLLFTWKVAIGYTFVKSSVESCFAEANINMSSSGLKHTGLHSKILRK